MPGVRFRPADFLFGVAALAGAAVLIWAGRGLTFFFDEWQVLLDPHPLAISTILSDHNHQWFVIPRIVYGLGLEAFGMTSQLPFRLVTVAAATTCAALLYVFVRRRTSDWLALVMVLPVLVLGASWEGLLLGLSLNFQIGMATGMGMLLALEGRSRRADLLAGFLLLCSLTCGGIGLAFAAGATVDVALRRDWRRIWIVLVPALAFATWFLLSQSGSESGIDYAGNLLHLPRYLADAAWAGVRAGLGLSSSEVLYLAGRYLAPVAVLLLAAASIWRVGFAGRQVSSRFYVAGGILLAFWVLGGLAYSDGRGPEASRYQYPAVVFLVAYLASLLEGLALPRWLPAAILPLALLSTGSNIVQLGDGRDFLLAQTRITRAAIGQVEIEGRGPAYFLTQEVTGSPYQRVIESNSYLHAADRFGSPAYSPEGIVDAGEDARAAAAGVKMAAAIVRSADRDR